MRGEPLSREQRPDGGRRTVPVATQEATGIDSRDATGWRPQAVPVSGKDASRDHRQRGGGSETQRRWRYGPDGHRRQDAG